MKTHLRRTLAVLLGAALMTTGTVLAVAPAAQAANPYLPEWEHIPDGEPHVFEDPDNPGHERLYIYGSHDINKTSYCGTDLVLWSAPVDDLNDWRYEGKIFEYTAPGASTADTFYAPDIAAVDEKQADGSTKKAYYLYPQDTASGRGGMVAKSYSPKGPFTVINWKDDTKTQTTGGDLGFDPAVFIDDDGKAYGYWGFQQSNGAEMQSNMYQIKQDTKITDMVSNNNQDGIFRFFEASSLRKVGDKYVFIYSRVTADGEGGLGASNATLAYAYGDTPLGPWTYGGTLVDARAPETGENGQAITTMASNNTHGSIIKIDGQWYVFYHRAVSGAYARQAMAEPIDVKVTADGAVKITQAEVTSEGLETHGLDPYATTSAGIASWVTGGSQIPRIDNPDYPEASDATAPVTNNTDGSIVGYKYFNLDGKPADGKTTQLSLNLTPQGVDGTIDIMVDRPWDNEHNAGAKVGSISVLASDPREAADYTARVPKLDALDGKHAIYLVFHSSSGKSVADLHSLKFGFTDAGAATKVEGLSITGASVNGGKAELTQGQTADLGVNVRPWDAADTSVTWSSSNPKVVSVTSDGTATAEHSGTATITATAVDGSGVSASLPFQVGGSELIANGTFDSTLDPWTVTKTKSDSTVVANTGYSTVYGSSGRSLNPKSRTYDGDAAQYPLTGLVGAGSSYQLTAHVLFKAADNPSAGSTATFSGVVRDGSGHAAAVSVEASPGGWVDLVGDVKLPAGFDASTAVLRIGTGDPAAPEAATKVSSFFVDSVSLKERPAASSDASLKTLTVAGQKVDVDAAASDDGASLAVADPAAVTPADVTADPTDDLAAAHVSVADGTVTVTVDAQDGTSAGYRVHLVEKADTTRPEVSLVSPTTAGPFQKLQIQVDATDDRGLARIVANVYRGSTLVKSTQTKVAGGATSGTHQATVSLPDGTYTIRYNAQDTSGNISKTSTRQVTVDTTAPTVAVKTGAGETVGADGVYSKVSFKLYDAGKIDKVTLNGVEKNLTDNAWSDVNYVTPGVFGATKGENTLVAYDVAGNTTTVTFTLS
ncbi:hypothetical protein GCM10023221_35120 [Luteimicrobium xylanilyticum]|uniref:Oligosaccharide reducing-end xylanase n=1 Tax=Luteimicrobium xylanilyticum TaxID=1133546 RepID=A0A5P9Q6Y1_9MICO|nr:family 43 glycosylhydrolase [Luteimicrobium xylanilyticum]QFU97173.1 Oligosaccharide reducing-end xylanase [Luteimicrobium xylanilyticum]